MTGFSYKPETPSYGIKSNEEKADAQVFKESVIFQQHCWTKIHGWCKAASSEVSGMGMARLTDRGIEVYEVFILKQKCSSSYTELDDLAVARLNMKLHRANKKPEDLRLWWHTHYDFGVFWSGTDDDNARRLVDMNGDWLCSVVINQKGDYRCRIDTVRPIKATIDNVKVYLSKNEKKVKRKRNYKSDIKRWVSPITYEAPDVGIANYVPSKAYLPGYGYDDMMGYGGYENPNVRGWEHFGKEVNKLNEPKKDSIEKTIALWKMKEKSSEIKKPDPKNYLLDEGEAMYFEGKRYVNYGGVMMDEEQLDLMLETGRMPDPEQYS